MKIAVTAGEPTMDADLDALFGRSAYFIIVDTDTLEFEAVGNPSDALGGGAGIQAAQLIAAKDVKFVLTGNCGPKAYDTLCAAGIKVIVGCSGAVRAVTERFMAGELDTANGPSVSAHTGMDIWPNC